MQQFVVLFFIERTIKELQKLGYRVEVVHFQQSLGHAWVGFRPCRNRVEIDQLAFSSHVEQTWNTGNSSAQGVTSGQDHWRRVLETGGKATDQARSREAKPIFSKFT
jgi:hypothetical protein